MTEQLLGYPLSAQQQRLVSLYGSTPPELCLTLEVMPRVVEPGRIADAVAQLNARHDGLRSHLATEAGEVVGFTVTDQGRLRAEATGTTVTVSAPAECADVMSLMRLGLELTVAGPGRDADPDVQFTQFCAWQQQMRLPDVPVLGAPQVRYHLTAAGRVAGPPRTGSRIASYDLAAAISWRPLQEAARRLEVQLRDLVGALWMGFLARRLGSDELTLGLSVDLRAFEELRGCVGPLTDMTPLTIEDVLSSSCGSIARRVHAAWAEAHEAVGDALPPRLRPDARLPYQFTSIAPPRLGQCRPVAISATAEPCELGLVLLECGSEPPGLVLQAGPELAPAMEELAAGFATMVATAAQRVEWPPARLPVVDLTSWRRRIVARSEDTTLDGRSLGEAFAAVSDRHAGLVALRPAGGPPVTYGQLRERVASAAGGLRVAGVRPGDTVGVVDTSWENTVVAALAALWAGAAFAVVDPAQPVAHLQSAFVGLSAAIVVGSVPDGVVTSAPIRDLLDLEAADPVPVCPVPAAALAHKVLTSGTTGWPRPVAVTHGNVQQYLGGLWAGVGSATQRHWATVAGLAVDLGYTCVYGALLSGGCLVELERRTALSLTDFQEWVGAIDIFKTTPSHLQALTDPRGVGDAVASLLPASALIVGGEPFSRELAERILTYGRPSLTLINHYGPAECCIGASMQVLSADALGSLATVPIGQGLGTTVPVVLDDCLQPTPAGVPGEIVITGGGVGAGYPGDPALTAAQFVPDIGGRPAAVMYRSGDVGVADQTGQVTHLGRRDDQVEVRGYRVEPDAIVSHLLSDSRVAQATVLPHRDSTGVTGLVAFVSPAPEMDEYHLDDTIVAGWTSVFEDLYGRDRQPGEMLDPTSGWNSSYTDAPMSLAEIHDSVSGIVDRARMLPHRSVLEVGCGTGLLIESLAPHTQRYVATDVSPQVLRAVADRLRERDWSHRVRLVSGPAHEMASSVGDSFDLVILNSIIQYFPSARYLEEVLRQALGLLAPGGTVFIGDVRDPRMVTTLERALALLRAPAGTTVADALREADVRLRQDDELLVDPAYFTEFARANGLTAEVLAKLGHLGTELTRYRYDVLLRRADPGAEPAPPVVHPWRPGIEPGSTGVSSAPVVLITDVPDARAGVDPPLVEAALAAEPGTEASVLRGQIAMATGFLPRQWQGPHTYVQPPRSGQAGRFDVLISASGSQWHSDAVRSRLVSPARRSLLRRLSQQLADVLEARLPEYARPAKILALDKMPLTSSGKIDRAALAYEASLTAMIPLSGRPPEGPIEEAVAAAWEAVIQAAGLPADVDFFQVGGHSLLAVQVVHRIRSDLGIGIPLQEFFERRTIAGQADWLRKELERLEAQS
jgi:non-ribosomal peptide synthetase component F/ubiquinone/menaquinone biosynthesis C-methylase UbiE